ncbi:MAG TPA: DegT/DnrJ/EryC1/StrS family aminotransferase [Candidatus Deferrimicrobiaceae bacterium]
MPRPAGNGPRVPFGTITITEKSKELIREALDSRRISSGKYVRMLEDRFAELAGAREAVAVSSGTDADALALAVLHDFGARRGDEIIVPALSFVATGNAVLQAGFRPVFVDVDRETLNLDPSRIERAVTDRTRAIMPVHLMGKPADMDAIREIAGRHALAVIDDAAEAHGTLYKGKPAGSLGDMTAFSLYVAHIVTSGEGGIVTTDREDYAEILRSLRSHGRACACRRCMLNLEGGYCPKRFRGEGGEDIRFRFDRIGYSCKMNELEAAIGLGAFDLYDEILARRRENLMHVLGRFDRFSPFLRTIREEPWERIGPHAVPIVVQEDASFTRADLSRFLEERGIETRTLFASMPTQCPGFSDLGYRLGEFPNAEYLGNHGLHVGVHQDLGLAEMDYVLETIAEFLESRQA